MMRTECIDPSLSPYIREVLLLEGGSEGAETRMPFFADGHPGILFADVAAPVLLFPQGKQLSRFFLYGQTIAPIELRITGPYKLIVYRLYPFATRLLLGVAPKLLNDECFDLSERYALLAGSQVDILRARTSAAQLEQLSDFLIQLVAQAAKDPDNAVKMAVTTIIDRRGAITIQALRDRLCITERTFERRFLNEVGVTPKQFARIVQFSCSMDQLKASDYTSLTNVAYDNGFADQSHFIRSFKQFTGHTPKEMLMQLF